MRLLDNQKLKFFFLFDYKDTGKNENNKVKLKISKKSKVSTINQQKSY